MNPIRRIKFNEIINKYKNKWYKLMNPLANYLDEREDKNYKRLKESITKEKAIEIVANELIKNYFKSTKRKFTFAVAEFVDTEMYSYVYTYRTWDWSFCKSKKSLIAKNKFKWDIPMQLKFIYYLQNHKYLDVKLLDNDKYINDYSYGIKGFNGLYEVKLKQK